MTAIDWDAEPGGDVGDDGDLPEGPLLEGDEAGGPSVDPLGDDE